MEIGSIKLDFLGHSGFLISHKSGRKIAIDPYNVSDKVKDKADFILITHGHYDHCSIRDIEKLSKEGTVIIIPADAQSKITKIDNVEMEIIEVGDSLEFGSIKILGVPAYNVGRDFHPKSEGFLGYVVKFENSVVYHAGDTDKIPEMKNLSGYGKRGTDFVALLPVSGKYTMNAEEAAEVASLLNPKVAVPMHYGAGVAGTMEDAEEFRELCTKKNINAEILEKL